MFREIVIYKCVIIRVFILLFILYVFEYNVICNNVGVYWYFEMVFDKLDSSI